MMRRVSLVSAAALTLSAAVAFAGTKYQGNIVPTSSSPPTLSNSSQFQIKGTGAALVKVKKLTDTAGPVTTTGTGPDTNYIAVLHGSAAGVAFQMSIVVSAKKGNGVVKPNFGPLVSLAGTGASVAITGFD